MKAALLYFVQCYYEAWKNCELSWVKVAPEGWRKHILLILCLTDSHNKRQQRLYVRKINKKQPPHSEETFSICIRRHLNHVTEEDTDLKLPDCFVFSHMICLCMLWYMVLAVQMHRPGLVGLFSSSGMSCIYAFYPVTQSWLKVVYKDRQCDEAGSVCVTVINFRYHGLKMPSATLCNFK